LGVFRSPIDRYAIEFLILFMESTKLVTPEALLGEATPMTW